MKVNQDYFGFASLRSGIGLKKKKEKKKSNRIDRSDAP